LFNIPSDALVEGLDWAGQEIHKTAHEKGWYENPRNDFEMLALVHSEVSEIVEALRNNNPPDDKCPQFSSAEVECADVIIRLLDQGQKNNWDIPRAILAKMQYNKTRSYKHGGKLA
jgi:hypothetical protein